MVQVVSQTVGRGDFTMIPRILEPEVMDTVEEAVDYDAMDHSTVNRFVTVHGLINDGD